MTAAERPRLVFVQFSDRLITPDDETRRYYERAYARLPGYHLPEHFFEVPYWIALIAGRLPTSRYAHELHIVTDLHHSLDYLQTTSPTVCLFSALEANVRPLRWLAERCRTPMVIGGYTDPAGFGDLPHVNYLAGVRELSRAFASVDANRLVDYELFRGLPCIPRYSLSTGCAFRCVFCTVPEQVTMAPDSEIEAQALALAPLEFSLAYLDDKSFGQAPNWRVLPRVREAIEQYNPAFEGFIVQTPPSLAARPGFLADCRRMGVKYIEFGVETVDDALLTRLRKPYRIKHLERAMRVAEEVGMPVIPNLIVGIPGDDYQATVDWVGRHRAQIPVVNVNWLAIHHGNGRGDLGLRDRTIADRDQNSPDKTWMSPADTELAWQAVHEIYELTYPGWSQPADAADATAQGGHRHAAYSL